MSTGWVVVVILLGIQLLDGILMATMKRQLDRTTDLCLSLADAYHGIMITLYPTERDMVEYPDRSGPLFRDDPV